MKLELPIFGEIVLEEEDWEYKYGYWKQEYDFQDISIDLDIHFKSEIEEKKIDRVSLALRNLDKIYLIGKESLKNDFGKGNAVDEYIEEWNEDVFHQMFKRDEFQNFIKGTDSSKTIEERLFTLIRLVRIGIYTESENYFVIMDFAFGYDSDFREDMLVVKLNPELEVTDICTEG